MINHSTLDFLDQLGLNNNTGWFHQHRDEFEKAKKEFHTFVEKVISIMSQYDQRLVGINSKECVFRINRDLRFSKDKSPYKDHFGAAIGPGGKRSPFSDYYIHIKPGNNSIVGGGIYRPDADVLSAIRKGLSIEGDKYEKIILEKKFSETFGGIRGETIKTTPKGFDKDNPWIDHIKRKDYYVMKEFKDEEVLSKEFFDNVIQTLQTLLPLNNFLNSHIQKIFE